MLIFESDQCEPCVDYGIRLCSKEFHCDGDDSPYLFFYDTVMIIIDSSKSLDSAVDENDVRLRRKVKQNTIAMERIILTELTRCRKCKAYSSYHKPRLQF